MSEITPDSFLPIELVFNPNWWHHSAGISFDEAFYLDAETRIRNDVIMRRVLHQRYGDLGLGEADPQPRPVIGSLHVAGGFVIPALLGARIRFEADAAPQPEPMHLMADPMACPAVSGIDSLPPPEWRSLWPMKQLSADMDALEAQYGYVIGDLNTDGLLNTAYYFCGQDVFTDFYHAPNRVRHAHHRPARATRAAVAFAIVEADDESVISNLVASGVGASLLREEVAILLQLLAA